MKLMTMAAGRRALVSSLCAMALVAGAAAWTGCKRRAPVRVYIQRHKAAPPRTEIKADPMVTDERYIKQVRRILTLRGCDSGSCHGMFKGGGLYFSTGNPRNLHDYENVVARIDRQHPEQSPLYRKATGLVEHTGGLNIAPGECDAKVLLAWIASQPEPECKPPPLPFTGERFAREAAPAFTALGCTDKKCHGRSGTGSARLDLSAIPDGHPEDGWVALQKTWLTRGPIWSAPVFKALLGEDGKHKRATDAESCAYRRIYTFIGGGIETSCTIGKPLSGQPSFKDFPLVMKTLGKRGCMDTNCHGGGAGGLSLYEWENDAHAMRHDYLMLTMRVEDFQKPDESTLLRTARNQEPHGGGKRLGGQGDCIDEVSAAWLRGKPVRGCPPPKEPSYPRFVSEIQPVLDHMTCTKALCHGGNLPIFELKAHATEKADLTANYKQVLSFSDLNFAPLSHVQLRMYEPCAYKIVNNWLENKPKPACVMGPPDEANFPKVEKRLAEKHL